MSILDSYRDSLDLRGSTLRARNVDILRRTIAQNAPGNPAYKPVTINGKKTHVTVSSKDDYAVKEISTLPGGKIPFGSDVIFRNMPWLVTSVDVDDEIYAKAKMQLCNCVLKWRDSDDVIHSYDGVAEDATKYSEGVESTQYLRIAEFQLKVKIHLDATSATIGRDMRFVIDADKYIDNIVADNDRPFVFKVTRRNIVTGSYNGEGYVEITLVQDQWIEGKDDYLDMFAAQPYELHDSYPVPTSPSGGSNEDTEDGWL